MSQGHPHELSAYDDLADAATPLHVVAYDLITGTEVVLSEGPAIDAITAASAVPGVLPPVVMASGA